MTTSTNQLLFVGSYAPEDKPGIYAYTFNQDTGGMAIQGSLAGITNPSFLAVHPKRKWLYAVSETSVEGDGGHGSVWAISYEAEPVKIQPLNQQTTKGDWPCHVQIDRSGRWLVASNYGTGDAALYPILPDGGLGEMQSFVQHEGRGPNATRQEGPHAHSATFTPDNGFVIVADLGIDQLVIYKFEVENGGLSRHGVAQLHPGAGPRHLAFHPDGHHVLVANELDSTVTVFRYEDGIGTFHPLQTVKSLPTDFPENTIADIHFSPSGQHVYVSNRGHNSVAVFEVAADRRLTRIAALPCGGNWPRNFAVAPNGQFMLVANRYSNQVSVLPILAGGRDLGKATVQVDIEQPSCVKFVK